jgi:hypothetical protein
MFVGGSITGSVASWSTSTLPSGSTIRTRTLL